MDENIIQEHDDAVEPWIRGGEVIHIWREDDFPVSYYICLFRHGELGLDCIRVYGSAKYGIRVMVSVDQRATIHDDTTDFMHRRVDVGHAQTSDDEIIAE